MVYTLILYVRGGGRGRILPPVSENAIYSPQGYDPGQISIHISVLYYIPVWKPSEPIMIEFPKVKVKAGQFTLFRCF